MNNLSVNWDILKKSALRGILAFLTLLSVYFLILTLVSGWRFTWEQFTQFWYFILSLALGFGIQFGLYSYLKGMAKEQISKGQLMATGTTSTASMISCCAHYLTNILPVLGVTGIITFISQYQVQFFWVGLFFNLLGIVYMGNKVLKTTGLTINKQSFSMNKVTIIYSGLIVVILVVVFSNSVSINIGSTDNADAASGPTQISNNNLETKESNEGPVSVAVTPQSLESSLPTWNFEISLNTHSGSIDADLVTVSELMDDKGRSYKAVSWEGSASGGHHRSGVLKFNPISPKPKSLELKIKNVGGVSERSFKWNL